MKIVIIGTGDIGAYLCHILSQKGHDIIAIEQNARIAEALNKDTDARIITGNGCDAKVLIAAGIQEADYALAMTEDDRTNLVSISLAKALGARRGIARIHHSIYSETTHFNYQLHFNIDHFIQPEALAAAEIAKLIRNPNHLALEAFSNGNIEIQQLLTHASSPLINKTLSNIQTTYNVRFLYIIRGESLLLPTTETALQSGDLITLTAPPETLFNFREQLNPGSTPLTQNIILFGATQTAFSLIQRFKDPRYKIHLIEPNHTLCQQFAEYFPSIKVIEGNATSRTLLEQEQLNACDHFIACSKEDESNIMTALQALQLRAKHAQIIIHRTDYEPILDHLKNTLGLHQVISPRSTATKELLRHLSAEPYTPLASLPGSAGKVWEIKVAHDSPAIGHTIDNLILPKPSMIIALIHKFHATIATPKDQILGGDRLMIASKASNLEALLDLFT